MKKKQRRPRFDGPVGARIKQLRDAKGWQQDDLAKEIGVHLSAVSHWENGISLPDVSRLSAVADALGTTVAALIEGEKAFAALSQIIEARAS